MAYNWPFMANGKPKTEEENMAAMLNTTNTPIALLGQMRQAIRMHIVCCAKETPIDELYKQCSDLPETQKYIADAPDNAEMLRNFRHAFVDGIRFYIDAP